MNKRLLSALIIPLMLVPLVSFGAAHLSDSVTKKYKLYIGRMCADITYFHVDFVQLIDRNNNEILFGDELKIEVVEIPCGAMQVRILVNPVSPEFVLNTTMIIENCEDLPWSVTWDWGVPLIRGPAWDNCTNDPCWDRIPTKTFPMWPSNLWSWKIKYYKVNATGEFEATPTQYWYKPGDKFKVVQHINLKQPLDQAELEEYKKIMGKWFWIWEVFRFESEPPITGSSWTYRPPS